MSSINQINHLNSDKLLAIDLNKKNHKTNEASNPQTTEGLEADYTLDLGNAKEEPGVYNGKYKVDLDKVKAMKEETEQRMLDLFRDTSRNTGLKQLGGIRGILDKLRNGEEVSLEIEYTAEDVEKAKQDVAPGGYWSAEKTSDRLLEFAKSLSGGDPSKSALLKDAFIKGFEEVKEMFGGKLPELSEETYAMTIEKFDAWANEASGV